MSLRDLVMSVGFNGSKAMDGLKDIGKLADKTEKGFADLGKMAQEAGKGIGKNMDDGEPKGKTQIIHSHPSP